MRAAPPVSVRCHGGRAWRWLHAVLPALAAAAATLWALSWAEISIAIAAVCAPCVGVAVGWLARRAAPTVVLAWDGQRWTADGNAGALEVTIDLGGWLLLRLRPDTGGRVRWIAVSSSEAGVALHGLRAAAYARPAETARGVGPKRIAD
jgi:hypothetical protein